MLSILIFIAILIVGIWSIGATIISLDFIYLYQPLTAKQKIRFTLRSFLWPWWIIEAFFKNDSQEGKS